MVAVAAGCGGSSSSSTPSATQTSRGTVTLTPASRGTSTATPPATAAPVLTPSASQLLLTVNDLPSGWAVDHSKSQISDSCYRNPLENTVRTSYATVDFAYGGTGPGLVEQVGTYADPARAFSTVTGKLSGCTGFGYAVSAGGQSATVTGTMGEMSFPNYGSESVTYLANLATQGTNLQQGFVVARQGDAVVIVALGNTGTIDTTQLESLTRLAMANVTAVQGRQ